LKQASFFEAAGAVLKIGLSLKQNHHLETLCINAWQEYPHSTNEEI